MRVIFALGLGLGATSRGDPALESRYVQDMSKICRRYVECYGRGVWPGCMVGVMSRICREYVPVMSRTRHWIALRLCPKYVGDMAAVIVEA